MCSRNASELGKHHVVPEVPEVKQKTKDDNDTENKHVLRCPLHLRIALRNFITLITTSLAVLGCQHKCINNVNHCKGGEAHCSHYCIPVGTKKFTNHVVTLFREQRHQVHTTMEGQEQNKRNSSDGHYNFSTNR